MIFLSLLSTVFKTATSGAGSFLSKIPKKVWYVLGALALLAVAFFGGRYSAPAKIHETVKTVTVETQKIVTVDKIVEKKVYIKVKAKDTHQEVTEVKNKDGTETIKIVTDTHSKEQDSKTDATTNKEKTSEELAKNSQTTSDKTVEYSKPQWMVQARVGAGAIITPKLTPQLMAEFEVDRRIWGPVFMGAWVNSQFTMSASPTNPFSFLGAAGGVTIGFEF